jgi:hypothetical protein
MDGAIVITGGSKRVDVSPRDRLRRQREHIGIGNERLLVRRQVRCRQRRDL